MRLIDADELLEWLEWLEHCDGGLDRDSLDIAIDGALQTVAMHVDNMDALGWIPVTERLPEDFAEVLVTWKNTNPASYYKKIKDVPFANPAVFYEGSWYWWSDNVTALLKEFGRRIMPIDADIEVTAWMRLPEPWKGEEEC